MQKKANKDSRFCSCTKFKDAETQAAYKSIYTEHLTWKMLENQILRASSCDLDTLLASTAKLIHSYD